MNPTAAAWSNASPSSYVARSLSYRLSGDRRPDDDRLTVVQAHPDVARHDPLR